MMNHKLKNETLACSNKQTNYTLCKNWAKCKRIIFSFVYSPIAIENRGRENPYLILKQLRDVMSFFL